MQARVPQELWAYAAMPGGPPLLLDPRQVFMIDQRRPLHLGQCAGGAATQLPETPSNQDATLRRPPARADNQVFCPVSSMNVLPANWRHQVGSCPEKPFGGLGILAKAFPLQAKHFPFRRKPTRQSLLHLVGLQALGGYLPQRQDVHQHVFGGQGRQKVSHVTAAPKMTDSHFFNVPQQVHLLKYPCRFKP